MNSSKTSSYSDYSTTIQPAHFGDGFSDSERAARWAYIDLYAPHNRYRETWCNGVQAQQPRKKTT